MINDKTTFKEIKEMDRIYLERVLKDLFKDISYDENYCGYVINGYKPLTEYLFEEENTILNPKELEEICDEIMKKLKKRQRRFLINRLQDGTGCE